MQDLKMNRPKSNMKKPTKMHKQNNQIGTQKPVLEKTHKDSSFKSIKKMTKNSTKPLTIHHPERGKTEKKFGISVIKMKWQWKKRNRPRLDSACGSVDCRRRLHLPGLCFSFPTEKSLFPNSSLCQMKIRNVFFFFFLFSNLSSIQKKQPDLMLGRREMCIESRVTFIWCPTVPLKYRLINKVVGSVQFSPFGTVTWTATCNRGHLRGFFTNTRKNPKTLLFQTLPVNCDSRSLSLFMEYVSPEGLRLDGRRPMEVNLSLSLMIFFLVFLSFIWGV